MNLAICIGIFHSNLSRNFWVLRSWLKRPGAWVPKDENDSWVSKVLSGLDSSSQPTPLREVFKRFFIWPQPLILVASQHRLFQSLVSVSTALFFPLKPLILLWKRLSAQAYQMLPASGQLWHGLRVLALDCTALTLPEALWPKFGAHKCSKGQNPTQCRLAVLYDLATRIPLACRAGHFLKEQDKHLVKKLLAPLGFNTLLILDAGFYGFMLFLTLLNKQAYFLIPKIQRAKPQLIQSFAGGDGLYEIRAHYRQRALLGHRQRMTVRIVTVYREGFRPRQLVTSLLNPQTFPAQDVAQLYHERWHIETFFREFKHTLSVQSWHARTAHAFYVELIFFMLLACLTRLAIIQSGKDPSSLSFEKAFILTTRILILSAFIPMNQWDTLYSQFLKILATYEIDIRPNRSFERNPSKRREQTRNRFTHSKETVKNEA